MNVLFEFFINYLLEAALKFDAKLIRIRLNSVLRQEIVFNNIS